MSRLEDLDRLYAVVKEKHGHIDILFANAGCGDVAPLAAATEAHFDKTFDVNVKGLFFTVQKAIPLFNDGGSIILTTSVANVMGLPRFSVYAATKAAVRSFVRSLAMELKDRKIRVNAVSPGPTETAAFEKRGHYPPARPNKRPPDLLRRFRSAAGANPRKSRLPSRFSPLTKALTSPA